MRKGECVNTFAWLQRYLQVGSEIATLCGGISVFLLWWQIKETHKWNRLKTSQEILSTLAIGELPNLREKVEVDSGCEVWNEEQNYTTKCSSLSSLEARRLRYTVIRILNVLEAISIDIEKKVVDEEICYNYLGGVFIQYARWSEPLIRELDTKDDRRVYEHLSDLATKWWKRSLKER
jgi:hypothetical protein